MLVSFIPVQGVKQRLMYKKWQHDSESQRFTPLQKTPFFSNIGSLILPRNWPSRKIESKITIGRQKKIEHFLVVVFAIIVTLFWKLSIVIINDVLIKELSRLQLMLKLREE